MGIASLGHPPDRRQSEPGKITVQGGAERLHTVTRAQRTPPAALFLPDQFWPGRWLLDQGPTILGAVVPAVAQSVVALLSLLLSAT